MKSDRDIEKMVARMGLKRGDRQAVVQYAKGMQDGMRMAYLAVARKMLAEGSGEGAVREFLAPFVKKSEMSSLLEEAENAGGTQSIR